MLSADKEALEGRGDPHEALDREEQERLAEEATNPVPKHVVPWREHESHARAQERRQNMQANEEEFKTRVKSLRVEPSASVLADDQTRDESPSPLATAARTYALCCFLHACLCVCLWSVAEANCSEAK